MKKPAIIELKITQVWEALYGIKPAYWMNWGKLISLVEKSRILGTNYEHGESARKSVGLWISYTYVYKDTMNGDESSANSYPYWHHFVFGAGLVEIFGQRPRGSIGVVPLNRRAAPGRTAVAIDEEGAVVIHNGNHDGVIDKTAQRGAVDLCEKHDTRRDLD